MEKKQKSLFEDLKANQRVNLSSIRGGNKSDAWWGGYEDSQMSSSQYDVLLPKLKDVEPTSTRSDKPILKPVDPVTPVYPGNPGDLPIFKL